MVAHFLNYWRDGRNRICDDIDELLGDYRQIPYIGVKIFARWQFGRVQLKGTISGQFCDLVDQVDEDGA